MAVRKDIEIRQNVGFRLESQWLDEEGLPKDLTGCQFKMQIRNKQGGSTLYGTWTNGNGFTLDAANGVWSVYIPETETANWTFSRGEYDVVITWPTNELDTIIYGTVALRKGVTV